MKKPKALAQLRIDHPAVRLGLLGQLPYLGWLRGGYARAVSRRA